MRTLSTAQTNLLQSSNRSVHVRIRVDRSSGAFGVDGDGAPYTGNFNTVSRSTSGTVTTASDTSLVGASTLFTKELSVGSLIELNDSGGLRTHITAIADDTHATMADAAASGQSGRALTIKAGSNIVDLSNYGGYNWIESVSWGTDIDAIGADADFQLFKQVDSLNISPFATNSLLNKNIGKASLPIDVSNKVIIEVAVLPMDRITPTSSTTTASHEWEEMFRGYIEDIDWASDTVNVKCRDLSAKYQDWLIYKNNTQDNLGNVSRYGNGYGFSTLSGTVSTSATDRTLTGSGTSFLTALQGKSSVYVDLPSGLKNLRIDVVTSNTSCLLLDYPNEASSGRDARTVGATNLSIYTILQNIMSSQNPGYDFEDTSSPAASYSHGNVDYHLYTPSGGPTPDDKAKLDAAITGTVTVPIKYSLEPNKIVGSGTKFTTELYVGAQIAITYTVDGGGTFSTIVDSIDSDTVMYVQDRSPSATGQASRPVVHDERPAYIPNKTFDVLDKTLMGASTEIAQGLGWNFLFKWNDNVTTTGPNNSIDATPKGAFVPMLVCPSRDRVTTNVDFTFTPSIYYDVSEISVSQSRMRNFIRVHYNKYVLQDGEVKTSNNQFAEVKNEQSIAKYGQRTVRVGGDEGSLALIDSQIEAERFGRAILKDLQNIDIVQSVDMPLFWAVELGDYYKFEANNNHYDNDQHLAVHSFRHTIESESATTSMVCRGKPSGYLNAYNSMNTSYSDSEVAPVLRIENQTLALTDTVVPGNFAVRTLPNAEVLRPLDLASTIFGADYIYPGARLSLSYNSDSITHSSLTDTAVLSSFYHAVGYQEDRQSDGLYFTLVTNIPAITLPGTVTIDSGVTSVTVDGTSTTFTSSFSVNDYISFQQLDASGNTQQWDAKITAIASNVELTIDAVESIGGSLENLTYSKAYHDCAVTVKGASLSPFSANSPDAVTLSTTGGWGGEAAVSAVRKSVVYYMSLDSNNFADVIKESRISFSEGGFFAGESNALGGKELTISGLSPGVTYYFVAATRVYTVPVVSAVTDPPMMAGVGPITYSPFSNVVEYTPTGNNAVFRDPNYSDMIQYNPDPDIGSWVESIRNDAEFNPNFAPPSNWQMMTGTWDTEFKRELGTVKSGVAAIKAPSDANAAAAIETKLFPAPASGLVRAISTMRTDHIDARFTMKLHEYRADKSTQNGTGTELLANGQAYLQTADEWIAASKGILLASTTKWCKFKFLRSNDTGNVYINDARLVNGIITFRASATTAVSAQVINAGATDTILFNDESTNPNHNVHQKYVRATGIYTIIRDGIYEFSSQVSVTLSAPDSSHFSDIDSFIQILAGGAVAAINYGEAISTTKAQFKITTGPVSLKKDDEVKVQIINGSAKDMTVVNTVGYSYFNGKEID